MKALSLEGKVILVTGASSGIGRACAISMSEAGGSVIITGRDINRLEETRRRLGERPCYSFAQDLTEYALIGPNIDNAVLALGRIDGFIHAAGIEEPTPIRQMTPDKYMNIYKINVIAGFELAKIISNKKYLPDSGACYIYISSVMGILGKPGLVGYCCSKAALVAGVKALALEFAPKNIRVNSVLPGIVEDTEMTRNLFRVLPEEAQKEIIHMHPLGLGTTKDVSQLCVYLLSDAARWITGAEILIDGGYSAQ
jgi:NAD(P)-dependent dehydrogenase (short-subunit alcohol dehydrogenase family)